MKLFWLNLQHQKSDILIKYSYSQTQEIWRNVYSEHIQIQEQESIPTLPAFVVLLTAPHQCLHCYSNLVFLSSPQERLSQDCLPRLTQKVSSSLLRNFSFTSIFLILAGRWWTLSENVWNEKQTNNGSGQTREKESWMEKSSDLQSTRPSIVNLVHSLSIVKSTLQQIVLSRGTRPIGLDTVETSVDFKV